MTAIEDSLTAARANEGAILSAVVEAGDLGISTSRIAQVTDISERTVRAVASRLLARNLVSRQGQRGPLRATLAGRAEAGSTLVGLGTVDTLDDALAGLPAEALRAFIRMLLSGIVARHHLRETRASGWLGFLACGPTGTGKTLAAEIACRVFGFNRETTIRLVEAETERSLWGRREGTGAAMTLRPSDPLGYPFLCLDELDKAPKDVHTAALKLLQGEARVAGEGSQVVDVTPCVLATSNAEAGKERSEYRRRAVVLDTGPIASLLADLDEAAYEILEPGTLPRFDLDTLRPPASALPEADRRWLRGIMKSALTEEGWRLLDRRGIELLALGRAALGDGDMRRAAAATAADYLTCAQIIGEASAGIPDELRHALGGPMAPDPETAENERMQLIDEADAQRRQAETDRLDLIGLRGAVRGRLSAASGALKNVPWHFRDLAAGLREQLATLRDEAGRSRSRQHLQEIVDRANPVLERVEAVMREIQGEEARRLDNEAVIRETKREAKNLDVQASQVRRLLGRTHTRSSENVASALISLGALTRQAETVRVRVPQLAQVQGKGHPRLVTQWVETRRTRIFYADVVGRRYESEDLDRFGPDTSSYAALTAKLESVEGERRTLHSRLSALTRTPASQLIGAGVPALPGVATGSTPPALSSPLWPDLAATTGAVTWGEPTGCWCGGTAKRADGRCVVHG